MAGAQIDSRHQVVTTSLIVCADTCLSFSCLRASCVQVLVAERGPLVFVFNWHPHQDYEGLKVAAPEPGTELSGWSVFASNGPSSWTVRKVCVPVQLARDIGEGGAKMLQLLNKVGGQPAFSWENPSGNTWGLMS